MISKPHPNLFRVLTHGRICGGLRAVVVASILSIGPAPTAAAGPETDRFQRIESLMRELRQELDSLKRDISVGDSAGRLTPDGSRQPPIFAELLTERQRALARATRTQARATAAGYTFNTDLVMGMHATHWWDPWGVKLEGGFIVTDQTRVAGIAGTGLYSIHRFNAFEVLETHLFAFGGGGYYWEQFLWETHIDEPWYETPDRWLRAQLGIGTELTFFEIGGVRFTPETGLQANRYLTRHEDSPSYTFNVPKSDFSLSPFFAFHISFYFR